MRVPEKRGSSAILRGESPPQAENFAVFWTPKTRFYKGETVQNGVQKNSDRDLC